MINPNYNLIDLKAALYDAFSKTHVSKTVCVGARPPATQGIDDFVVIRIISPVRDNWATGKTICRVELYARDLYGGENPALSDMYIKTKEALSYLAHAYPKYVFQANDLTDRGSDGLDFHSISIDLTTTIKN